MFRFAPGALVLASERALEPPGAEGRESVRERLISDSKCESPSEHSESSSPPDSSGTPCCWIRKISLSTFDMGMAAGSDLVSREGDPSAASITALLVHSRTARSREPGANLPFSGLLAESAVRLPDACAGWRRACRVRAVHGRA